MRPEKRPRFCSLSVSSVRVLVAILFAFAVFHPAAAQTAQPAPQSTAIPAYDSQTFIQELGRLKAGLESARLSTESLRSYREALPEAWAVDAGGRHYEVPTDLLVSRIVKAERQPEIRGQQVDEARGYLDALASETESLSGQTLLSSDSARTKLNAILARSEYAHVQQESWWEKLRAQLSEILANALLRILRGVGGQASLGYALLWIGICAAAILIAYWIFRRWFRAARVQEMDLQAAAVPSRSWQEWIFAARERIEIFVVQKITNREFLKCGVAA